MTEKSGYGTAGTPLITIDVEKGSAQPEPSQDHLAQLEAYYRISFPAAYRDWLKTSNGVIPRGGAVFVAGGREYLLERFLPVLEAPREAGTLGWYDVTVVLTQIEDRLIDDEDLVGTNMLPVAALFGGDFVCLDYRRDPANPTVVVWDHNLSDEGAPHVEHVCGSFSEFLCRLRPATA